MATSLSGSAIYENNPYDGHPNMSDLEAEVLWEYAKLSQNVKEVRYMDTHGRIALIILFLPVADCRDAPFERSTG